METAKPRLVDLAADMLAMPLALSQVPELPDAAAIRARALELKGRFERDAGALGFTAADIEDALFAMVAFLDETVLDNRGAARDFWLQRPLQLELYGRNVAGEEFFDRLDRLRHEREGRIEALEVYACCLAFGFQGRHRLGGGSALEALLDQVQHDVEAVRGARPGPLAPHSARRNERLAAERKGLPWWLAPTVFVGGTLVAWFLIWLVARLDAGGAAKTIARLVKP